MMLNVILPWFPIVLSAAVGARLVSRSRAVWLGATCALYFVIVVQMTAGIPFWADPAMAASIISGSAAIVGLAEWSSRKGERESEGSRRIEERDAQGGASVADSAAHPGALSCATASIKRFDDWLESHRHSVDSWAAFDEFLRHELLECCGATHARPYRILSEGDALAPLRVMDSVGQGDALSARLGVLGHVATTGRTYYAWDNAHGELVDSLAEKTSHAPVWCFAIRSGAKTIGLVSVGQLGDRIPSQGELRLWEHLIGQYWTTLTEVCRGRSAAHSDSATGLLTRNAFLDDAQRAADDSYRNGEPVVVCAIAVEGLRLLLDRGLWDLADHTIRLVSGTIRGRIRPDDIAGRFDDSRLLLLMRRVDSDLARLITTQLAQRLSETVRLALDDETGDAPLGSGESPGEVAARCGVAGSGNQQPPVVDLVTQAVRLCHFARERDRVVVCDIDDGESVRAVVSAQDVAQ